MESQGLSTLSSPDWPVLWMSPPLHIKTEFEICRKHPDFKIIQVGSFGERIDRSGGAKTVCWTQERVFNPQTECDFIISSHSHIFPYIPITHFNPFSLHFKIAKSFHRFPCRLGSVFWSNQNGDTKLRRLCDVSPIKKSDDFKTFLWESFKLWEKHEKHLQKFAKQQNKTQTSTKQVFFTVSRCHGWGWTHWTRSAPSTDSDELHRCDGSSSFGLASLTEVRKFRWKIWKFAKSYKLQVTSSLSSFVQVGLGSFVESYAVTQWHVVAYEQRSKPRLIGSCWII